MVAFAKFQWTAQLSNNYVSPSLASRTLMAYEFEPLPAKPYEMIRMILFTGS